MDSSSLTVLSVAYPFAPVGPATAGGAEQVLSMLDDALVAAGHRSLVIGRSDSRVRGTLIPIGRANETPRTPAAYGEAYAFVRRAIARVQASERIDVVHLHGCDAPAYLPEARRRPVLVTLHMARAHYEEELWRDRAPGLHLQCVSAAQRRSFTDLDVTCIENGVDLAQFAKPSRRLGFVAALGRVCPEKGYHHALDAARIANVPLLLAGQVYAYPKHVEYFAREIEPRLDSSRRFVGPVGPYARRRLLGGARCLLIPSLCEETSSLVAMEAIASGTPVVAFPNGALAHVVDEGRTGFLVHSTAEMAAAIRRCDDIDPDVCRETARRRFSAARMTGEYLSLYRRLASDHGAH